MANNNTTNTSTGIPPPHPERELDAAALAAVPDRNPALLEAYIRQRWTLERLDRVRQQYFTTSASPGHCQSHCQSQNAGGVPEPRLAHPARSVSTTGVPQRMLSERQGTPSELFPPRFWCFEPRGSLGAGGVQATFSPKCP